MLEIEKLYANAGLNNLWVERYSVDRHTEIKCWHKSYKEMIKAMMQKYDWNREEAINVAKIECKKELPPFTAKKQLELIKWCLFKCEDIENLHFGIKKNKVFIHHMQFASTYCESLKEAIAGFINDMWRSFTPEEKAEIKRILED